MKKTFYEDWIKRYIFEETGVHISTLKELREYQLEKIRKTIEYAKQNSKFYKKKLKNIEVDSIKNFKDFSNIPFTFPCELCNKPLDFLCVPQYMISRIVTLKTSGTTGRQKRVFFTEKDLERTIDFFHNGMRNIVSKGDKVLILMPGDYYGSIGDLLRKGLERLGCDGIVLGPLKDPFKALEILGNKNIDCIVGIPVQVYKLARYKMAYNKYANIKLKSVLLSADYTPESIKKVVEEAFSCPVFTHYGMTEMGFGGGVECRYLSGYHMREADLYFEIVDPISKKILPFGSKGEVVFTTLTREGMPLIRYRTGDCSKFIVESCKCSNILPRMDYVKGRLSEQIKFKDFIIDIGDLDEVMFKIPNLLDYKAEIVERGVLCIYVKSMNSRKPVKKAEIQKALKGSIFSQIFKKNQFSFKYCGEIEDIPISTGMLKRKLVDKRK